MTHQYTKLADKLDATAGNNSDMYEHERDSCREAARILRAAAGVDVAGLLDAADRYALAKADPAHWRAALESALRLVLAQRVPPEILAISERLHTQDNRITQDPLFAVQQKRRIYGVEDGYRDGVVWIDDEGNESPDGGPFKRGSRKVGYIDIWEFVTGCFTEQGCKDFIACNGHNLNEPRIYAYGSYRNAEFIALRKWLMSLAAAPQAKEQTA